MITHTEATAKGSRDHQEDRYFVQRVSGGIIAAVFDGHGGDRCSSLSSTSLLSAFVDVDRELEDDAEGFIKNALADLVKGANIFTYEGSTVSLAFIPDSEDKVITAVLGDSPIIVRTTAFSTWVAPEHNVRSNPQEAADATERGGFISHGYLCSSFHSGGIQMSRVLGDYSLSKVLSREPEINVKPLEPGSWVLVATDGIADPGHIGTGDDYGVAPISPPLDSVIYAIDNGYTVTAQDLVNRALTLPTNDNVTAILLKVC